MKKFIVLSGLILVSLFWVSGVNGGMVNDHATATFVVRWYDVGVIALAGRPGLISVEKGWRRAIEINHVTFDPEKIDLQQIEKLLKKSGTYIRTVEESAKDDR